MDVNSVLLNTFSADAAIRGAAEAQLTQAAETNFAGYLVTLVQELANEEAQGPVRAAAGIALKNAFTAREYARLQSCRRSGFSWMEIPRSASRT